LTKQRNALKYQVSKDICIAIGCKYVKKPEETQPGVGVLHGEDQEK
jgi:hypothetical protein